MQRIYVKSGEKVEEKWEKLPKGAYFSSLLTTSGYQWTGKIVSEYYIPAYREVEIWVVNPTPTEKGQHLATVYDKCWIGGQEFCEEGYFMERISMCSAVVLEHKHLEIAPEWMT